MTTNAAMGMVKGEYLSTDGGDGTDAAIMEISVEFLQKSRNIYDSTVEKISKVLYLTLERYVLIHFHSCYIHNGQEMGKNLDVH